MSWWNNTGITTLASVALKTAQKRIDKVLDIQDEEDNGSPPRISSSDIKVDDLAPSSPLTTDDTTDSGEFWNKWLVSDKLSSLSSKVKAKGDNQSDKTSKSSDSPEDTGTFSTDFLTSTLTSSLSKAQQLKNIGSSGILKLKSQSSEKWSTADSQVKTISAKADSIKQTGKSDESSLTGSTSSISTNDDASLGLKDSEKDAGSLVISNATGDGNANVSVSEPLKIIVSSPSPQVSTAGGSLLTAEAALADELTIHGEASAEDLLNEPDDTSSGWGDVSLSLLTESQASSASSVIGETPEGSAPVKEPVPHENNSDKPAADLSESVAPTTEEEKCTSVDAFSLQTAVETSGNAWNIPELTDSALEGIAAETETIVSEAEDASESQDIKETVDEKLDEKSSQKMEDPEASEKHEDQPLFTSSESKSTKVMQEEASSGNETDEVAKEEEKPADEMQTLNTTAVAVESAECDSIITKEVSSMEGSTDTQDELSSSNRTLTADESDPAKLSSGSSQVTLELSPDEGQGDGDTTPKQSTLEGNETPEKDSAAKESIQKCAIPAASQEGSSKETLTSSSYVKNMLEEAMVESMKDTDSHTDSHSSSDMVRIESGPTSGHTSADEIETNTSSDIEIISHISTPTPNGENRLFDLSPLRHALSRTMHRTSPPAHRRSDSSSSGQSRNGEEMTSPDGLQKSTAIAKQIPPRKEKRDMKKAVEPDMSSALDADKLLKKLAETAEILDARERRVMELSRENIELQEANSILRQQLEQSEEARELEMTDLNTLTEEFTKRMSEAEKKIQAVIREKEAIKKKLLDTEAELAKRANDKAMERIMREKDQQIAELLEEGEKLSKQQLQSNNIIKKLRAKEKENESLIKSQKAKLDEQKAEIERLLQVLDNKVEIEKKQAEAINQLNNAVQMQEAEINRLKSDLEDYVEKNRSLQVILDNSYKEIAELHKAQAAKASEAQELALSAEIKAKEELQVTLEQYKQQMKQEQEGLLTQIEDLQLSLGRMEKEHGRREDILRQEIADLQKRLQEAEERNQELTQSVTQATRPLLRQIENLQATFSAQTASYERVEKNLTERLTEAQTALALAQEKERNAVDRVIEVDVKLSTLESQVAQLRQEKSRLQAALEMEKTKLELLEDARNNETAQLEAQKLNYQKEIEDVRKEKILLENQLEMEKVRTESEKKKVVMLHEQLREKEIQLMQTRKAAASPTPSFSRESSFTAESPMNISQQEEALEKTLMLAAANGGKTTLYESLKQAGATTILENLQAQLKMREGEIAQLQSDIQELERTRESMARELVSLTNQNELLQDQLKEYPQFMEKYKDLDQRYNALLMMYGEKVEEAEELRLDLQDVKDLYRAQIDELLRNK